MDRAQARVLFELMIVSLLVVAVSPFIGMQNLGLSVLDGSRGDPLLTSIFWKIRVPRVCMAFIAGASLALGGMVFQAVFRNFLASPFTLGVSSGAAFGAALYFNLGISAQFFFLSGSSLFSICGAVLTIIPVYLVSESRREISSTEILLCGVVLSFFFSSLILFIQYLSDFTGILHITRWLMGGFDTVGFAAVLGMLVFVLPGLALAFLFGRELNLFTLGDELASSRGLDVRRAKTLLFVLTSIMIGGVVAFCGPISSVGIMAPHICRLLIGHDHRYLAPATFLLGGAFVVACDTVARTIIAPYEIPVGVITAILEGPFFLWLLLSRRGRS